MNKTSLLLSALLGTAALAAQTAAQADELYAPQQVASPAGPLTRAQVRQSVLDARRTGALNHTDVDLPSTNTVEFGKTRAEVRGEVLAARAQGGLDHDDVDLPHLAKGAVPQRSTAQGDTLASRHAVKTAPGRNTIDY